MANTRYILHHGLYFDSQSFAHLEYLDTEKEKWRQARRASIPGSWEWLKADERATAYSDAYMHAFRKLCKENKSNSTKSNKQTDNGNEKQY